MLLLRSSVIIVGTISQRRRSPRKKVREKHILLASKDPSDATDLKCFQKDELFQVNLNGVREKHILLPSKDPSDATDLKCFYEDKKLFQVNVRRVMGGLSTAATISRDPENNLDPKKNFSRLIFSVNRSKLFSFLGRNLRSTFGIL